MLSRFSGLFKIEVEYYSSLLCLFNKYTNTAGRKTMKITPKDTYNKYPNASEKINASM